MDGHGILAIIEQVVGGALIALVILDVFLTVLYARMGTSIVARRLVCWGWQAARAASKPLRRFRSGVLGFAGPVLLVLSIGLWVLALTCGAAMIVHPRLAQSIRSNTGGPVPTDFVTALYVTGDLMSTAGTSDLAPATPAFRLFLTFLSFLGISVLTLSITYVLEVYNALQRRNTCVLKVHLATGNTGDAAELIASLGPGGRFDTGYTHLAESAAEVIGLKESHHFYPVLFYFRFRDPHYAMSRLTLVTLDTVTLIKSALDDEEYGWLKESMAVAQLWRASMWMLTLLAITFLPGGLPDANREPEPALLDQWRRRYFAALHRLRQAGIRTIRDEEAGAVTYVSLRARWDRYIRSFSGYMAHTMEEVDPVGSHPESVAERQDFTIRLRSAG